MEHSIRLECLKLAHRHDREPADNIARASTYADFVTGLKEPQKIEAKTPVSKKGSKPKNAEDPSAKASVG